uniref:Uncharacterized protein n=1 Tax=Astyanax mexicanus TaxID=7994 RepID=A0A8B9K101_ASTMX
MSSGGEKHSKTSVCDFVCLASEDLQNPNTSGFHSRLGDCRSTVSALEESLETDLSCLQRMKKMVKSIHATGLSDKEQYTEVLENLGNSHLSQDNNEISTGFLNLAVFTREVTTLFKTLVQNLNSILSFPLESILKHELRDTRLVSWLNWSSLCEGSVSRVTAQFFQCTHGHIMGDIPKEYKLLVQVLLAHL